MCRKKMCWRLPFSNADGKLSAFVREGEQFDLCGLDGDGEAFEDTMMPIILRNAASIRLLAPLGAGGTSGRHTIWLSPRVTVQVRFRELVEIGGAVRRGRR